MLTFSCCPLFFLVLGCYGSKMVAEKAFFSKKIFWEFFLTGEGLQSGG